MKNYKKYADEIREYDGDDFCCSFIRPHILKADNCSDMPCSRCQMLQTLWLLEDCEESKVDWSKVEVDTPLLVRKYKNGEWSKRYFAKYEDGKVYTWYNGRTSWNETSMYAWDYAKLAEPEADWNKVEVDTPILVRDVKYRRWVKRYFAKYKDGQPIIKDCIKTNDEIREMLDSDCIIKGDLHLFNREDNYQDIVNNFIDLKDQWVKVDNIDLLTPVYLKSNQEYLNK